MLVRWGQASACGHPKDQIQPKLVSKSKQEESEWQEEEKVEQEKTKRNETKERNQEEDESVLSYFVASLLLRFLTLKTFPFAMSIPVVSTASQSPPTAERLAGPLALQRFELTISPRNDYVIFATKTKLSSLSLLLLSLPFSFSFVFYVSFSSPSRRSFSPKLMMTKHDDR